MIPFQKALSASSLRVIIAPGVQYLRHSVHHQSYTSKHPSQIHPKTRQESKTKSLRVKNMTILFPTQNKPAHWQGSAQVGEFIPSVKLGPQGRETSSPIFPDDGVVVALDLMIKGSAENLIRLHHGPVLSFPQNTFSLLAHFLRGHDVLAGLQILIGLQGITGYRSFLFLSYPFLQSNQYLR